MGIQVHQAVVDFGQVLYLETMALGEEVLVQYLPSQFPPGK